MPGDGKCMECGAQVRPYLSNCNPPVEPCEQCGQCVCLARPEIS